ncbi:MAG: trypsin-like peptidase domain-containing protein [Proteiniphilum sp.]
MPRYVARPFLRSCLLFALAFISAAASGQISHGGQPLPLTAGAGARALGSAADLFVEMPSFDVQAALRNALHDRQNLKSLEFAHKFDVHLRPDNSGIRFTAAGMEVWRVGIRSRGAHSLNLLFSKFRLPEGARLFVYNADQTEVLGSYTRENNSNLNLLPVQPIGGEELIVEYQVPLHATDKGEIEIGDVNHDFVGILRATEPRDPEQSCHPDLICYPENIEPGSGVVALIINGTLFCTGALVNNTAEDGTPYLLTATHCLNMNNANNFNLNRRYDLIAGSVVAFFNYQSPVCGTGGTGIRGPVQMTLASADSVLISERYDISLLRFKDVPPVEYQPRYLGWNAASTARSTSPFHGLHHPNGGIKKVAIEEDRLTLGSFNASNYTIETEPNAFWIVRDWETAATEGGSSGSPLLDREKRIVGTLTGGSSECGGPAGPDIYGSLEMFWSVNGSLDNPNPISYYLDPEGTGAMQLSGYNPYQNDPYTRSQNFRTNEAAAVSYFQSVPLFATNNTFGYTEFAEQFHAGENAQLRGVFISSPATSNMNNLNIRIRVYAGEDGPERVLYQLPYTYSYRYYASANDFPATGRDMRHRLENYIEFENPVSVSGPFYISYSDANNVPAGFTVFNAEPRRLGAEIASTAWMKNSNGWVRSSENIENPMNTSLLIAPYVIGEESMVVVPDRDELELKAYHSAEMQRILIESNRDLLQWEIYYSSGIRVHRESTDISLNRASYPAAHLPRGIYIVRVQTVDGTSATKKVLVM